MREKKIAGLLFQPLFFLMLVFQLGPLSGCAGSAAHMRDIDARIMAHIEEAKVGLHGEKNGYSRERPADTLRRRLFDGQEGLGLSHPASRDGWEFLRAYHAPLQEGIPPPAHDAAMSAVADPLPLRLSEALQAGARNSQEYQEAKDQIFRAALDLELESAAFRHTVTGLLEIMLSKDFQPAGQGAGSEFRGTLGVAKRFEAGMELSARIVFDLVKLLSGDRASAVGILGDATITIPLLRGAGAEVAREPLTQAQRSLLYAMGRFEQYKRGFAVRVASDYLGVLRAYNEMENTTANAANLEKSAKRASRLAEAGRLAIKQVGQSAQLALRAQERLLQTRQNHERLLDTFKKSLGLPPDARIVLDSTELDRIGAAIAAGQRGEPTAAPADDADGALRVQLDIAGRRLTARDAIAVALSKRSELLITHGEIEDKSRKLAIAADQLRPELTITAGASIGEERSLASVGLDNTRLRPEHGLYSAGLTLDPAFDRTTEAIGYRMALLDLEKAVRALAEREDSVKLEVRNGFRSLAESAGRIRIQEEATQLAKRRVAGTTLLFDAGRAEMRDILDAEEDFLTARNSYTAAMVRYRLAELELQRDLGLLVVGSDGLIVD